jgi:hypothetical protein
MPHKLLAVALCLCAGCSIYSNAAHNLFREPCDYLQGRILSHALRKQAQDAWRAFAAEHPEWCHNDDFEAGFVDGFADYLDNGGKGAPPAIPPKRYRKNKYLNPEGFEAIDLYFSGFAAGSRVAKESGRRDTLVVPVLVPIPADPPPTARPEPGPSPRPAVPPMPELPAPRPITQR